MSSRLNVKTSRKDNRPRSSDKLRKGKREGTPEKPTTPNTSQDALLEEGSPQPEKTSVIINDEILGLAIKHDDLEKLREPRPPSERKKSPVTATVVVRKLKPASEWDKPKPRIVTVARPAPPEAPLQPIDFTGGSGARFNEQGAIIAHSILGSEDDYKRMAVTEGDLPQDFVQPSAHAFLPPAKTTKYERKPTPKHPKMQSVDDSNALRNWQLKMLERKRQQGYLSNLLNKAPEDLVMNQADEYRNTQELRYLIDRTIPSLDYGKGYRVGSEFWNQRERIGDDLTGMHMTLTQTEQGYPPPIERIGVPRNILQEKGSNWSRPTTPFNKPWHKTPYLHERMAQLQPVMNELDPYNPDLVNIEVVGKPAGKIPAYANEQDGRQSGLSMLSDVDQQLDEAEDEENKDPLRDYADVYPETVLGPSILFAGQPARWTGETSNFKGHVGIEARVTFETYAGQRGTSFLEIVNDGTTAVYYDWKKIPKSNPFDLVNAKVQRFYFNNSSGVILPGETIKFPFVFKSPNAGVFTEQWQFQTHPVVCGGAALMVTLRGVALQEDKYMKQRSELEMELSHKQAVQIVRGVLDNVIEGIRTPERPSSPVDAYITEDQIFKKKNPNLHHHNEAVNALHNLFMEMIPEEEQENKEWDLSVATLKKMVMDMDEEDERKQEFLQRLNIAVLHLSFPPFTATQKHMHAVGYEIFSDAVDQMTDQCLAIRNVLGMPDKEPDDGSDEPNVHISSPVKERKTSAGDGKKAGTGRGSKQDTREKKTLEVKDAKKPPKTPAGASKEKPNPGKITTPAQPVAKRPATRGDRATTPTSGHQSPVQSGVDPVLNAKYKDKLYTQTYLLLCDMIDNMDQAFQQVIAQSGGIGLPKL